MLTRIQARNYRCLKHVDQQLSHFDILVGGNGVGKSTFLDVIQFVSELLEQPRNGVSGAVQARSDAFDSLLFDPSIHAFELSLEADVPQEILERLCCFRASIHFRIKIGFRGGDSRELGVVAEKLLLTIWPSEILGEPTRSFPVVTRIGPPEDTTVFQSEIAKTEPAGWSHFKLSPGASALANLPEDETQFPASTWFRRYLVDQITRLNLDPSTLKKPQANDYFSARSNRDFNLPRTADIFCVNNPEAFVDWIQHLRVALPDLQQISVVERPEDRKQYLIAHYVDGRRVPSWLLSDGTLRLIGLTLPAYALDDGRILLIEEPENCIHPLAIEVVMQSLSSMYESQVFVTTHSPAILSLAEPENILCFSKSVEEGTSIVRGSDHPRLSEWKKSVDLGTLLASGILG